MKSVMILMLLLSFFAGYTQAQNIIVPPPSPPPHNWWTFTYFHCDPPSCDEETDTTDGWVFAEGYALCVNSQIVAMNVKVWATGCNLPVYMDATIIDDTSNFKFVRVGGVLVAYLNEGMEAYGNSYVEEPSGAIVENVSASSYEFCDGSSYYSPPVKGPC